uniref:Uncharacterized protein n=1 Tax=Podarcis muralis TaxID=64176 RepID=A0A670K0H0_PODMU
MSSESFCLAAQTRFDSKWLKTDLQLAFTRDGLCGLWNEMVKDGEIVYTGTEPSQNGEASPRKGEFHCVVYLYSSVKTNVPKFLLRVYL